MNNENLLGKPLRASHNLLKHNSRQSAFYSSYLSTERRSIESNLWWFIWGKLWLALEKSSVNNLCINILEDSLKR